MKTKFSFKLLIVLLSTFNCLAQVHLDQNGLKTSVINTLGTNTTQPKRFEIANVGYNSYHWQETGVIVIELFEQYFSNGYEKYFVEIGFGQGGNSGEPLAKLVESKSYSHYARITLGNPSDLSSVYYGQINRVIPIYLDIKYYARYKVRITYLQDRVSAVSYNNQISINENPTPLDIDDFTIPTTIDSYNDISTTGNLNIKGSGNHYIANGNVGIGTTNPQNKLDVNGTIHAREVKVDLIGWADFVFAPNYKLRPLPEVEQFIKTNGHLPEIPKAEEVQQNGVNLGEMQTKLLQKVEELTLYSIEQEKANAKLEKKLAEQDAKYQQLLRMIENLTTRKN